MKGKTLSYITGCLVALSIVFTACSSPSPEEPEPTLTETKKQQLDEQMSEQGGCNVDTLDEASYIAGFPVATPSYLPEGFHRGSNIMVTQLGGGLPEDMKPKFTAINVEMRYYWQEDDSVVFTLTQTKHKFGIGGSEPTEICGGQGERKFQEADPQRRNPNPVLTLGWENDGRYYNITGILAGPLDEDTLEKIVCSVGTD